VTSSRTTPSWQSAIDRQRATRWQWLPNDPIFGDSAERDKNWRSEKILEDFRFTDRIPRLEKRVDQVQIKRSITILSGEDAKLSIQTDDTDAGFDRELQLCGLHCSFA